MHWLRQGDAVAFPIEGGLGSEADEDEDDRRWREFESDTVIQPASAL